MRVPRKRQFRLFAAALLVAACASGGQARADSAFVGADTAGYGDGDLRAGRSSDGFSGDCGDCGEAHGPRRLLSYGAVGWGVYTLYGALSGPAGSRVAPSSSFTVKGAEAAFENAVTPSLIAAGFDLTHGAAVDGAPGGLFVSVAGLTGEGAPAFRFSDLGANTRRPVSAVQTVANPEPLTMILLGTGLAGVAGAARMRRRSR